MLSLSNSSDVIEQLTAYIAQDQRRDGLHHGQGRPVGDGGQPGVRGHRRCPRAEWPLLDTYVPKTESDCRQKNPGVYFTQIAAPVTTLRKIAEAVLDAWPNVQTRCDVRPRAREPYKLGRVDRQSVRLPLHARHRQPR